MAIFSTNNVGGVRAIPSSNTPLAQSHKSELRPNYSVGIETVMPNPKHWGSRSTEKAGKACDRCRLKKCKCNGSYPCQRCHKDNAICNTTKRRPVPERILSNEEIRVLQIEHAQLTEGLQHLYRLTQNGQRWEGPPVEQDENKQPLVHLILERLGVVKAKTTARSVSTLGKARPGEKRIPEQHEPVYSKAQIETLETSFHRFPVEAWKTEDSFSDPSYELQQPLDEVFGWDNCLAENFYLTCPLDGEELFRT